MGFTGQFRARCACNPDPKWREAQLRGPGGFFNTVATSPEEKDQAGRLFHRIPVCHL